MNAIPRSTYHHAPVEAASGELHPELAMWGAVLAQLHRDLYSDDKRLAATAHVDLHSQHVTDLCVDLGLEPKYIRRLMLAGPPQHRRQIAAVHDTTRTTMTETNSQAATADVLTCIQCGQPMEPSRTGQRKKYCSQKCTRDYWRDKERTERKRKPKKRKAAKRRTTEVVADMAATQANADDAHRIFAEAWLLARGLDALPIDQLAEYLTAWDGSRARARLGGAA